MNLNLTGKKVLVTGGTHGIGLAISIQLAKEGCDVAVFSRTVERVNSTQKTLDSLGSNNICLVADVLDEKSYEYVEKEIKEQWGGVDILVNNIGGGGRWGNDDIIDTDEFVWKEVYDKNLTSTMKYTKMFLPYMMKNNWGRIVTITSTYGKEVGGKPWFNIAKTSQTTLMKNLAVNSKYASKGITFNSVAPGAIMIPDTGWEDMKRNDRLEFDRFQSNLPRGRLGTPEEVSNLVTFLCSNNASLVNGASILVDGGESRVL